ncbi:CPSF A subunit region-domain-containing protein [Crepidotus variabilis]|uniref:CPSF A subunit region-domain-containing protein n=1 Tax=Crepidotus variabilis TaxID=179855 RepID=A0A9P6EES3_9AGAR|nr:CPSF A subunit region-domain-containing protein [Crepidotus variabilis]
MHALHQQILPASGVEFATSLKLTPSTLQDQISTRHELFSRVLCNLVVARANLLRIFEVRVEPAPVPQDEERDRRSTVRRGTEAVEGEVQMDEQGDGYINIAKSITQKTPAHAPSVTRFYLIREHRLHGMVTGMEGVRTVASQEDHLDRLLISFKDAKIALLEWADSVYDLVTVSIHTYERAPQLLALDSTLFRAELRCEPLSRCAALSLPKHALAILPFVQAQADLDVVDHDQSQLRDIPYSPSFILDLPSQVDQKLRNVIDFVFLPGFNNPTLAVLFQTEQTWTGRLTEFKDTVKLIIFTLDVASQNYPILTSVENLPYDCLYLLACSTSLGGVVIVTSNALIYLDQSSRRVTLPVNGWTSRISDIPILPADPERRLILEGSRSVFVDDKNFFVILKDGTVYPVEIVVDGKTVSKLTMAPPLAQTSIPSIAMYIGEDHIFVGSTAGPSVLLKSAHVEEEVEPDGPDAAPTAVVQDDNTMDYDDDDADIYGVSSKPAPSTNTNGTATSSTVVKKTRTVIHLSLKDAIPAHGPIADMAFSLAKNGDRPVPELVAATGCGPTGGFTLFQRDLPILTKRKVHIIGGARGLWSLPIRQQVKASGISYEKAANPYQVENDTLILSTDINPSPGLSRIASKSAKGDVAITTRIPGTTIGAGAFFQRTAILHVMTNAIRVLEPDGTERQTIKDMDGNMPRPKIRACSISDPFVFIIREDDSIGLFIGETERGRIRRKDMTPMGDKTSKYLTGCFYMDSTGLFEKHYENSVSPTTSTLQATVSAGNGSQWLVLMRPQGIMEIWTLPKLMLAFTTDGLSMLQNVLTDSHDPPALSLPQDPPRKPQDLDVEQLLIAPIGESSPRPHLCVFLRSGQLTLYEVVPAGQTLEPLDKVRPSHLNLHFIKIASIAFEIQRQEETVEKSIIAEQKRISRNFVPFVTSPGGGVTYSGVFFTGDRPNWITSSNKSGVQIYPSGHGVVHAFTACSLWDSKGDFLLYTEEGPCLLEWLPNLELQGPLPLRFIPRGRSYSNVLFDSSTGLVVAASSLPAKFASYDDDGIKVWEPDAPNIPDPTTDCSTLELVSPDLWITLDGYEFATNEYINDMTCMTLETASTESGSKDFIVVGTTVNRGEDLAAKGATYIFEIVEVVPDPAILPKRWYKLRLRCRDEAKGPVTAVCGFTGYLVSSMGQKIFVRAFDSDERLVGVAFMDVGVYVTSLRSLKNLLLVGDAVKSVMFVAFQEDPYKLVLLGKDIKRITVTSADFLFTDGELSIITGDEEGIIRVYEYSPQDPDSNDGRYLLLRTEFHGQSEYRTATTIARRTKDDPEIPQSKLLMGSPDGSLTSLTPVSEDAYKRLQLLQGQLTRNIQHTAGLNPRAFRIVRNEYVGKPLSKGILDGSLLAQYEALPITRQNEMTKEIGTERIMVLRDWIGLTGPW